MSTVIDGKGHMMGRLASIVAKELLSGNKVVVIRCEAIIISGSCKFAIIRLVIYSYPVNTNQWPFTMGSTDFMVDQLNLSSFSCFIF